MIRFKFSFCLFSILVHIFGSCLFVFWVMFVYLFFFTIELLWKIDKPKYRKHLPNSKIDDVSLMLLTWNKFQLRKKCTWKHSKELKESISICVCCLCCLFMFHVSFSLFFFTLNSNLGLFFIQALSPKMSGRYNKELIK